MRRGPSGMVVCCICRKWLPRAEAVGVNTKHCHVEGCFAVALRRIGEALNVVNIAGFSAAAAFKLGLQHGEVLRETEEAKRKK